MERNDLVLLPYEQAMSRILKERTLLCVADFSFEHRLLRYGGRGCWEADIQRRTGMVTGNVDVLVVPLKIIILLKTKEALCIIL